MRAPSAPRQRRDPRAKAASATSLFRREFPRRRRPAHTSNSAFDEPTLRSIGDRPFLQWSRREHLAPNPRFVSIAPARAPVRTGDADHVSGTVHRCGANAPRKGCVSLASNRTCPTANTHVIAEQADLGVSNGTKRDGADVWFAPPGPRRRFRDHRLEALHAGERQAANGRVRLDNSLARAVTCRTFAGFSRHERHWRD